MIHMDCACRVPKNYVQRLRGTLTRTRATDSLAAARPA